MTKYTKNEELSSIHFLNDRNIAQELDSQIEFNPVPSLSLLNKVNTNINTKIDNLCVAISTDISTNRENIANLDLSVGNLSGLLNSTITSCDTLNGRVDELCVALSTDIIVNRNNITNLDLSVGDLSGLLKSTITSCDNLNGRIDSLCSEVVYTDKFVTSVKEEGGKLTASTASKVTDSFIDDETISESKIKFLTSDLTNLSSNYVKKSGDTIDTLEVKGDLKVTNNGNIVSRYFKTEDDGKISFIGQGDDKHGSFNIDIEGGMEKVNVNGTSLSGHIKNAIDALDVENKKATFGQIFSDIKQENGKIEVLLRNLSAEDIPTIKQDQVLDLSTDFVRYDTFKTTLDKPENTKEFFKDERLTFKVVVQDGKHYLQLTNLDTSKVLSVNVDDFIAGKIAESIDVVAEGPGYPKEDGPYLKVTWKTDSGTNTTYTPIKHLIKIYKSTDSKGGLSVDDYSIYLNYDVVTERGLFNPVASYVNELSNGIIDELSADVKEAFKRNVRNIKFDGCVKHVVEGNTIADIFRNNSEVGSEHLVRNNALYRIQMEDEGYTTLSDVFTTFEGLKFTNSDYLLVHNHDASKEKIAPEDIALSDVIVLKTGVSRIDFDTECFLRLSADQDLSNYIWSLDGEVVLTGDTPESLSVLTKVTQTDGKVNFEKKLLLSSDVCGLSSWVKAKIEELDVPVICADNQLLFAASETDGKIAAYTRYLTSADFENNKLCIDQIHTLPESLTDLSGQTSYISTYINNLDYSEPSAGMFVKNVVQNDGKISSEYSKVTNDYINDETISKGKITGLNASLEDLSTQVSCKIWIENATDSALSNGDYSDLSVIKINKYDYDKKVLDNDICESAIYIISSDFIDAYGEQLCNLTMPGGYEGVATTKPYVDEVAKTEETLRKDGDTFLSGKIDNEVTTRTEGDTFLSGKVDNEVTARTEGDSYISSSMDTIMFGMWNNLSTILNTKSVKKAESYELSDCINAVFAVTEYLSAWYTTKVS